MIPVFHRISPNALVQEIMKTGMARYHAITINNSVTGRLGFLAGVRRQASRLADLEQAGSVDTLPPSGRCDPTKMIAKVKGPLISTGPVPIPHTTVGRRHSPAGQAASLRNRVLIRSR